MIALLFGCGAPSSGVANPPKEKIYSKVVSLSPSTSELIGELGAGTYLVGRSASCDRPEQMMNVKIVVNGTTPDYEQITELAPDLIVYDKSLYSDEVVAKLQALGFETLELNAQTIDEFRDFCEKLASRIAIEMTMSRYLDKVYQSVALASGRKTTKPRTTILLGDGSEGYLVMGVKGLQAFVIEKCGATPIGVDGEKFAEMNLEKLIDLDPEIIYSDGSAAAVLSDARLQGLSAVKNKHVYNIDGKDILRFGARMHTIIDEIGLKVYEMPVSEVAR